MSEVTSYRSATPEFVLPHLPRVGYGILLPGERVIYQGSPATFACRQVGYSVCTVTWCEEYLGQIRLRLAEHPGFTFRRCLFAVMP